MVSTKTRCLSSSTARWIVSSTRFISSCRSGCATRWNSTFDRYVIPVWKSLKPRRKVVRSASSISAYRPRTSVCMMAKTLLLGMERLRATSLIPTGLRTAAM